MVNGSCADWAQQAPNILVVDPGARQPAGAVYRFVDRSAPRGSHLYRLRVIRTDGTAAWAASARSA